MATCLVDLHSWSWKVDARIETVARPSANGSAGTSNCPRLAHLPRPATAGPESQLVADLLCRHPSIQDVKGVDVAAPRPRPRGLRVKLRRYETQLPCRL